MPKAYLAGPVTGLPFSDAEDWRIQVTRELLAHRIECVSPLRGLDHLRGQPNLFKSPHADGLHPLTTDAGCVARCRNDVMTCDLVLANCLGSKRASVGTCVELGWADAFRKPVILVMEPGDPHDHAMPRGIAACRVETLERAVTLVKHFLLSSEPLPRPIDILARRQRTAADAAREGEHRRQVEEGLDNVKEWRKGEESS